MLLLISPLLGLALGLALGGRLGRLADVRLAWWPVVPLALVVKELGVLGPLAASPAAPAVYVVSLAALTAWIFLHRRRLPCIWPLLAGVGLNLVVVVANLGRMPVRAALAHRGPTQLATQGAWGQYELAGPATRLNWLGDTIALPGRLGAVFPEAYSAGDLVVAVGLFITLFLLVRPLGWRLQVLDRRLPKGGV